MLYGDLQFFDIIIFAAIAGFIIYRLRSVLGKRTGFQKTTTDHKPTFNKEEEDQGSKKYHLCLIIRPSLKTFIKK